MAIIVQRIGGNLVENTPPASEPVTLVEAKAHLRVDHTDDDTLITTLRVTARKWCEGYTYRSFINTTWEYYLDEFIEDRTDVRIELPKPPLVSITEVRYEDEASVSKTLTEGTDFQVSTQTYIGFIMPEADKFWPDTELDRANAVKITYVAGFGATASDVPEDIKHAILMLIAHLYETREGYGFAGFPTKIELPPIVTALLDTHQVRKIV